MAAIVHGFREHQLLRRDASWNNAVQQPIGDNTKVPSIQDRMYIRERRGLGVGLCPRLALGTWNVSELHSPGLWWDKNITNLLEQKAACLGAKKGISFKAETLESLWRNCGAALWALFLASPLHPPPHFPVWKSLPRGRRCLSEVDKEHHLVVAQTTPWRWQRLSKWSQGWQMLHRLHSQIHPSLFTPSPPPSSLLFITMPTEEKSSCKN